MPWNTLMPDSEQYNYEYFQRNNVCRICWSPNASREITTNSENELTRSLYDKLLYCLDINITDCNNVNKLCCDCIDEIDKFYNFKLFCHETNAKLQQIISNRKESNAFKLEIEKLDILKLEPEFSEDSTSFDYVEQVHEVTIKKVPVNKSQHIFEDIHPSAYGAKRKESEVLSKNTTSKIELAEPIKIKRVRKHSPIPNFCSTCHLDCESEEKFTEHNASYHGIERNGSMFKCFGCEKRFRNKKLRASHELNFCKGLKDGYKCSICERFLPKRNMYDMHMRRHLHNKRTDLPNDIFKCKKCLRTFETNDSLNKHMETHEVKKSYVCETCGRVFTRHDYLYKHTLTHAGIKRHCCPHCDFKTTQRSSLTMHIRKHTGERPYSCDLCPQRCVSSSNLRAHRRRHLHIKNYECKICTKKFGYKISLDEHVSSTHERTELHSCGQCGATYSRVRGLRRHLAAKHGKQQDTEVTNKTTELGIENVHDDQTKVAIIKNVRYEIKDGDLVLIKNPECVFTIEGV